MRLRVRLYPIFVTLILTIVVSKLILILSPTGIEGENIRDYKDSYLIHVLIDIREKYILYIINRKVYTSSKTIRDLSIDIDFLAGII